MTIKIVIDRKKNILDATGHVVLMSQDQVFSGETIRYQMVTGDFRITNAVMVANDAAVASDVINRLLGFTPTEKKFESERAKRIVEIKDRQGSIREEARRQIRAGRDVDGDLIEQYALLLEQENLTKIQDLV